MRISVAAEQLAEVGARQVLLMHLQLRPLRLLLLLAGAEGIGFASWCNAASEGSVDRQ